MELDRNVSGFAGWSIVLILLLVVGWLVVIAVGSSTNQLRVSFLDVGQGDATLIETPNGNEVLVDTGRAGKANRPLSRILPFYDRQLDIVIGTHADTDHMGGLPDVLADYRVGQVVLPARSAQTQAWQAAVAASRKEQQTGAQLRQLEAGQVLKLDTGVYLLALAPPATAVPTGKNESSLVFKLIYGDTSMLLPGDIPEDIELYLADRFGQFLDADILKVAHHGSDTSSSRPFLSAVSPRHAIISAGADNRYGHPHEQVVDRLKQIQANTTCTCEAGTVTFVSDGREFGRVQ